MTFSFERKWWKECSVYQVWPASFCDSNGDGIGDLKGIESKLDHIKSLSTDLIWISPCFSSPQVDMGYDVSDYKDVHPAYGTLQDLEDLLAAAKSKKMKVILDLVLNHCSEQHAWFQESKSSLDNPKRNWFHWKKGTTDEKTGEKLPPNNWEGIFKGSAWTYDEKTDEWYLHLFLPEQPDFNWENPEVREAMYDICRFWLDRGASGFRLDACQFLSKPIGYTDAPIVEPSQYLQPVVKHVAHGPRIHEYLMELHEQVMSKYEHAYTVGETAGSNEPEILLKYIRPERKELDTVFNFELAEIDGSHEDYVKPREWKLSEFKQITSKWQRAMIESGAWNAIYLENHDQARSISRYASDLPEFRSLSGKLLSMHLASLCGTVYVYQGQELGQINVDSSWLIDEFKDIGSKNLYNDHLTKRRVIQGIQDVDMSDVVRALKNKSRDNARTPVQWSDEIHGGHSALPWMRIHDDHKTWNAKTHGEDPLSVLNFYRKMFKIRKESDLLIYGDYHELNYSSEQIFAYRRDLEGQTAVVLLNFSKEVVGFTVPALEGGKSLDGAELLIGNYDVGEGEKVNAEGKVRLRPFEGRILLLRR